MAEVTANGVRLYHEEHGEGAPILCVHGSSSSARLWRDAAVERLASLGRVILYDRRGCGRSERPDPYSTSVSEQADDAAALLEALGTGPAIVIGRSYGGSIALQLAVDHPELVRALVLLEPDANAYDQEAAEFDERVRQAVEEAAASDPSAAAEALLREVLGADGWEGFSEEVRAIFEANSPAVLAEMRGPGMEASIEDLRAIKVPTLLVSGESSHPVFGRINGRLDELIPLSRPVSVAGGHLVDPGDPSVVEFIQGVIGGAT